MHFYGNKLIRSIQNIKRKQKTHLEIEKPIKQTFTKSINCLFTIFYPYFTKILNEQITLIEHNIIK